ncbi:MAG: hypothetical protein MJH09_02085 [Cetobacterium sp.]|nr:hypothetical protein [Cetobacterium sp.]
MEISKFLLFLNVMISSRAYYSSRSREFSIKHMKASLILFMIITIVEIYIDKVKLISYMIYLIFLILWIIKYIKIIKEDL